MIQISKRCLFIVALLIIQTGCRGTSSEPAHLQLISMIPGVDDARIEIIPIQSTSEKKETFALEYAEPSGYHTFKPGEYEIIYKTGSNPILKHTIVLGKKSYQTLLSVGMLPDSLSTNPHTTIHTIKKVLAGSENQDANGYLPQFIMLRDLYRGRKNEGMIRLVNASPFANNIILKKQKKNLQTLAYPLYSDPLPVQAGEETFHFFLGNVQLAQKEIQINEGYIHTFITANSISSGNSLKVVTYQTASEAIRDK